MLFRLSSNSMRNILQCFLLWLCIQHVSLSCEYGSEQDGCRRRCSEHCVNQSSCNFTNGACIGGCTRGYMPPNCTLKFPACSRKYELDSDATQMLVAFLVVSIVFIVFIVPITTAYLRKYDKQGNFWTHGSRKHSVWSIRRSIKETEECRRQHRVQ
ncbi:uncharacterized protein LOC131948965 [Physella acuta]|uniref:uncharacterized protein LOC131948965 n=1 Tax=Physella acuta TaxID=109671 RepID=UPI0027DCE47A|nr:uncharacterized protein LOC131948965 [Physella acuta]